MTVNAELINAQADAQCIRVPEKARAGELAVDVARFVEGVSAARNHLDFNDEPARFAALLASAAAPEKTRR